MLSRAKKLKIASCKLQHLQPIAVHCAIDGISPLTERAPDDGHHGRGAAHFLATFNFYCSYLWHVVTCSLQALSFDFLARDSIC